MSPMEKFFASLKRLLEPRTPPPAESIERPTAGRPPPLITEPAPSQGAATQDAQQDAAPRDAGPAADVAPPADDISRPADDVSEVRALLEAVAEAPVAAPEPEAQVFLPLPEPDPIQVREPAPIVSGDRTTSPEGQTPTDPSSSNEPPAVAESTTQPEGVDGALVLTLVTPAAVFTIARTGATLGRGQENTLRLDDFSVSRRHARIAYRGGGYWLSDLGSMGGTWIDGAKLNAPRRIAAGQVIDIGVCRLTVSFAADREPIATRKSASKPRSEIAAPARRRR